MEESTSTDEDSSLQLQPQPTLTSQIVEEIAKEWNTSNSSSEDEKHVNTSFQQNVSKQFKMPKTIFEIPKTRIRPTTTRDQNESILDVDMVNLFSFSNYTVTYSQTTKILIFISYFTISHNPVLNNYHLI